MVSFFGLKFGADKRKKTAEPPPRLAPQQDEEYIGRRESYMPHDGSINHRPRTSQGTHGPRGLYPGEPSSSQPADTDFKGIRAVLLGTTAAVPAGTGPVLSPTLKTFSSDSALRVSLGPRKMSSTSLHMPPRRPGEAAGETGPRPGTAHSMRGSGAQKPFLPLHLPNVSTSAFGAPPRSPLEQDGPYSPGYYDSESSPGTVRDFGDHKPSLHIDLPNVSTTTFGGTPKSPLGQYEFSSPLKSDTDSLLGDDPGKIVDQIAARITQEEKMAKPQVSEERRRLEVELEEQRRKLDAAKRNLEAARLRMAYPSPPASIESEQDASGSGRKPSIASQVASHQEGRLTSVGLDTTLTTSSPASGTPSSDVLPTIEAPPSSPKIRPPAGPAAEGPTGGQLSLDSQMLRPQQPRETLRSPTVPGASPPPRSPLFQQMSPFDVHSDEDLDEKDHRVDHRAANAPYGLPSPPLSHHQRPGKEDDDGEDGEDEREEEEGLPVLRTVQAKRDTTLVGGPGRTSLGLQIEEFEKSLQQAQAMSALENGPDAISHLHIRADSNASSTYSDLSDAGDSPMVIEPPLVSPKPFPLSPRPMRPREPTQADTPASIAASLSSSSSGPPTLEIRSESPFGSFYDSFAKRTGMFERPATPTAVGERPRPRLGAVKPSRPTLGEYGPVKVNTVATLAGRRVQRPTRDDYVVSPARSASPFHKDSPILKDVVRQTRSPGGPEDMTDGFYSSPDTSRATSPAATVGSYSVFSPPPPVKQRSKIPLPRSAKPEWYSPAPSGPPKSPLPNTEKSSIGGVAAPSSSHRIPTTPQPALTPSTPGLRTSPSIVPDLNSNPDWPLPASPKAFASPPEAGFTARRSLHRDGRAPPPAPINIMATRYADEVGGEGGPWTPQVAPQPTMAAGEEGFEIRSDFSGWREEPAPHQRDMLSDGESIESIGVARGLSIKYDQVRERERRARGHDKIKRMAIVTVDEDGPVASGPASPTTGEPLDRLRRPNHGLKSPMGFADQQGIRFI